MTRAGPGAPFKVNAVQTGFALLSELIMCLSKRQVGWPVPLTDGVRKGIVYKGAAVRSPPSAIVEPEPASPSTADAAEPEQAIGHGGGVDAGSDVVHPNSDGDNDENADGGGGGGDDEDGDNAEDTADAKSDGAASTVADNAENDVRIARCSRLNH